MYKEHPQLEKPNNEKAAIWRYMEFAKFLSLLDRREHTHLARMLTSCWHSIVDELARAIIIYA